MYIQYLVASEYAQKEFFQLDESGPISYILRVVEFYVNVTSIKCTDGHKVKVDNLNIRNRCITKNKPARNRYCRCHLLLSLYLLVPRIA
jgi:hypothetical protein